ncbi:ankyrin repeat-containing domain protein [Lasiosphaeria ovina]|uniref:Ankyrin repeat-containing domain protein n=1 Tax=Lasiosphaeria ovina TaxID=92902 RepID=A0AAE0K7C7_9PEZI|nr:ankyrin repeat-containing domain protein [Lasiosphaeria ovina]
MSSTPLHLACVLGDENIVQWLLQHVVDINAAGKDGESPLTDARWKGRHDIARILVDNGAFVNMQSRDGTTPIMFSTWHGHTNGVKLLHKSQADLLSCTTNGENLLMSAARVRSPKIFLPPLKCGLNPPQ